MPSIITVRNLSREYYTSKRYPGFIGGIRTLFSREYERVKAIDDVNFSVEYGEIVGYIGPNGAGKSTTFKLLSGVLVPTSGHVETDGCCPHKKRQQLASRIGVIFGHRSQLWWDLPLKDSLEILRAIYQIPEAVYQRNLDEFKYLLDLDALLQIPVRQLSLGQRMRGELAAAFLHNPKIALLDEPFLGLDIVVRERARRFIRASNQKRGTSILLASNDMADVEQLCSRVLIVDKGKLLYDGSIEELKRCYTPYRILTIQTGEVYSNLWAHDARLVSYDSTKAVFHFERSVNPQRVIHDLSERYLIKDLAIEEPSLEEVIRELYDDTQPRSLLVVE